jgi:hypothetical protein
MLQVSPFFECRNKSDDSRCGGQGHFARDCTSGGQQGGYGGGYGGGGGFGGHQGGRSNMTCYVSYSRLCSAQD